MTAGMEFAELRSALRAHAKRYPLMDIQDSVKLMYQHEFACRHIIKDPIAAYAYLSEEYSSLRQQEAPLLEDIGGGLCRINLRALEANGITVTDVFRWMGRTAESRIGDKQRFIASLDLLWEEGEPYSYELERVERFLAEYSRADYPALHHSTRYKAAYSPAYRVIGAEHVSGFKII